ncbi:glycosyltransferase 87 family protein [Modestobacter sp. VKM Ac-2985]|uniref:glycosyltransferase 87 family protein n=1 Tax=Modestobacter sp. VKM Ac-2985 TaxID=3004139 RepID=UPI0022AB8A98|nr:hypothetical protein [Modestobacter sp. VKM Ac-2985]MCZ2837700.1 hypothetical protein [Modestobacter sp. VKM Ac-2985]
MSTTATRAEPRTSGWHAVTREPWRTVAVVAPLAVVGLLLAPLFRNDIGLDGLAYVSIARQYAEGGLPVNGYWGPLWSWFLVPLLVVGVEPLLAAGVLQVASAVLALVAFRRLADVAGARPAVRDAMALAISPFLLAMAHYGVFVDVLMAGFLLLWCSEVLRPDFPTSRSVALRAGLWAGLAVLTKIYALPFVVVHLAVVLVLHLYRSRGVPGAWRRVGASGVLAVVVIGVLFAPWVAALTATYDRFTVTKSARYNVTIAGPGSEGNPIRYAGLLTPPSEEAVSIWEDPSRMPVNADGWDAGGESADRLLDNVTDTVLLGTDLLTDDMVVVSALGIAGTVLVLFVRRRERVESSSRLVVTGIVAAGAIYAGGYAVLFVERRYTWFLLLLLAVPAVLLVQELLATQPARRRRWLLPVGATVLALTVALQAVPRMLEQADEGARAQEVAAALRSAGGVTGPVASNGFWERTAVICFELECQFYGQPRDHELGEGLDELLEERGIATFVAWGDPLTDPPGREVTPDGLENVHVYEVSSAN